jgi:hypothetical protein
MRTDITVNLTLISVTCCNCGIPFAMAETFYDSRLRDGKNFFCPSGHQQHFTESETDRLRKELKRMRDLRDDAVTRWRAAQDQTTAAERSRRALKGALTRQRNRAAAGVCPADGCHRSFTNLREHIASQHPEFRDGDD